MESIERKVSRLLSGDMRWLTRQSHKLDKSQAWRNVGLTLSPWTESLRWTGVNTCPNANACQLACVGSKTGRGKMPGAKAARIARTKALMIHFDDALPLIVREIVSLRGNVAVRLNVASDLPLQAEAIARAARSAGFTGVFYDYTANPNANRCGGVLRALSRKGNNAESVLRWLAEGYPVAVVFDINRNDPKPATWNGYPVIDGDFDDVWWNRAPNAYGAGGYVVGLYLKGSNAQKAWARKRGLAVAP